MTKLENIFERVLVSAARVREIKQVRYNSLDTGTYVLNQYKRLETSSQIAEREIAAGTVGRDYLLKAVSNTNKRNKEYSKYKNRR
jgi:DNA-directed RNA polymerase subunit K/omega